MRQALRYGIFRFLRSNSLIMEFANNGDLFQKIVEHQKNSTCFTESEVWSVFIQVVTGLRSLHALNILHRDLKSANVFLFHDSTAKLGDLNVSKIAKKGLGYTQTGTPYYASPEVWRDQPYDAKSDIWSLGCVLYEMITLKPPFRAEDMASLYKKVLKGIYPKIPSVYSAELSNLVKSLLQVSAYMRPSCEKILRMSSVQKWSEKLFPSENLAEGPENNILLTTIRVPKNLLYLTDKLPKPRYASVDEAGISQENRLNVTDGASCVENEEKLPCIPKAKIPKRKQKGGHSAEREQYISNPVPIVRSYKIPKQKKHMENNEQEQNSPILEEKLVIPNEKPEIRIPVVEYKIKQKQVNVPSENMLENKEFSSPQLLNNNIKQSPLHIAKKKITHGILENDSRHAASIIDQHRPHHNYLDNLMKLENNVNNLSNIGQDSYLNNIISNKNPLVKHPNEAKSIKDLANIYSGGILQGNMKQIIAMHKRKIDKILEANRENKERNRSVRLIGQANSLNPNIINEIDQQELKISNVLPAPFKVKSLMPKAKKVGLPKLPNYGNKDLISDPNKELQYLPTMVNQVN